MACNEMACTVDKDARHKGVFFYPQGDIRIDQQLKVICTNSHNLGGPSKWEVAFGKMIEIDISGQIYLPFPFL